MGYETRISTKGQIVVPKELRDRHDWTPGSRVEFVERGGAVYLRTLPNDNDSSTTSAEILARLAARNLYSGPPISLEDMDRGIEQAIIEKWGKRL